MPRAGNVRCWVSSPSSVSFLSCPACFPAAPRPAALPGSPASAGSTTLPVSASKLYSRRANAPCSGLALSVPAVCLVGFPALPLSAAMPRCAHGGAAILGPPIYSSPPPPAPCALVARMMGGVCPLPAPVHSPLVCPRLWWSLRGFHPPGETLPLWGCRCPLATRLSFSLPGGTPMGFPPLRRAHGPRPPSWVLVGHSRGLAAPVVARHSSVFSGLIFLPASRPPPVRRPCPMAAMRFRLVRGRAGGFPGVAPAGHRVPRYLSLSAVLRPPRCCRLHLSFPPRTPRRRCLLICRRSF